MFGKREVTIQVMIPKFSVPVNYAILHACAMNVLGGKGKVTSSEEMIKIIDYRDRMHREISASIESFGEADPCNVKDMNALAERIHKDLPATVIKKQYK